jgi:hypothetical protein
MTEQAKLNGLLEKWKKEPSLIIICWFNGTLHQIESHFNRETARNPILLIANQVHTAEIKDKPVVFAEHYPLRNKEEELFQRLSLTEITIHSALDEPLFDHFGGAKIVQMMKQLGMKENDPVQHKMITQSITNAQEKIAKKLDTEQLASSQREWMQKNIS